MLKILTAATVALVLIPSVSQAASALRTITLNRGAFVMLNPQPLPPAPCKACGMISPKLMLNTKVLMFRR